jgi:hypothetical protein
VKQGVGDRGRIGAVHPSGADDLVGRVDHVPEHREQVFLDAADHLAVDKGGGRRVGDLQLDAPGVAHDLYRKGLVALQDFVGVVAVAPGVEHRQRAAPEQRVEALGAGIEQLGDFGLREALKAPARTDARVNGVGKDDTGFHGEWFPGGRSSLRARLRA